MNRESVCVVSRFNEMQISKFGPGALNAAEFGLLIVRVASLTHDAPELAC